MCNDISTSEYKELEKELDEVSWFCEKCTTDMFPSGSLPNEELLGIVDFDLPSFIDSAPMFEITSNLMNLPNLSDFDIDEHMPQNIDSRYLTLPELSSLQLSSSDFSILHANIRSLSLHQDELVSLSAHTNLNLYVIGVSEICILMTILFHLMLIFLALPSLTLFHMERGAFFAPPPTEQFNVAVRRQARRG